MLFFKQFGVGLATAVLIDATIVRAMLLPATMKLLGDWNWYLPRWLEWLPRLDSYEPEVEAEPALVPAEAAPRVAARKRALTPGRITGLLLIGLVVGLGYLRVSSADAVSVPAGQKAGDLVMNPCTYGTEDGGYEADCGTLVVPEPTRRAVTAHRLPVKRMRSLSRPGRADLPPQGGRASPT